MVLLIVDVSLYQLEDTQLWLDELFGWIMQVFWDLISFLDCVYILQKVFSLTGNNVLFFYFVMKYTTTPQFLVFSSSQIDFLLVVFEFLFKKGKELLLSLKLIVFIRIRKSFPMIFYEYVFFNFLIQLVVLRVGLEYFVIWNFLCMIWNELLI